ncbi:MAG: prepilin peptidase [Gammaproteobacteria bacterium]|nr:prepilin peptidase [Gammaproteobacteria bacterium]
MSLYELLQEWPAFLIFCASLLGLLVGSFLNVVIYRLPIMLRRDWQQQCREVLELEPSAPQSSFNLAQPRSQCPECANPIPAWHNIPLISWLLLRGRCRHCQASISIRYPLIELLSGVLSGLLAWRYGMDWTLLAALILIWSLIVLSFIDLEHQLLPDQITLPLIWLGLLFNQQGLFTDLNSALLGAVFGYLFLWSIFHIYRLLRGREGFGYGDFKLLAALGAWLGWQSLPLIVLLASVIGSLVGILLVLRRKHRISQPLPFGPYLAGAGLVALVWGDEIVHAYLRLSGLIQV